jgi:hypothetical protein
MSSSNRETPDSRSVPARVVDSSSERVEGIVAGAVVGTPAELTEITNPIRKALESGLNPVYPDTR